MNTIHFDAHALCGERITVVDARPVYNYDSAGKMTNEVIGCKYAVVLPQYGYERIWVKVLGDSQIGVEQGHPVVVDFDDFTATAYVNRYNRGDLAFRASAIRVIGNT